MTSTVRHETGIAPWQDLHAQLRAEAGAVLRETAGPFTDLFRELADLAIPVLAAAGSRRSTDTDATTRRLRELAARFALHDSGIDNAVRCVDEFTKRALHGVMNESGSDVAELVRTVSKAGSKLAADLLTGANKAAEQRTNSTRAKGKSQRARELLSGETTASVEDYDLAPAYAVVAVHCATARDATDLINMFEQTAGEGTLTAFSSTGGFALLPAEDEARALQLARRARAALPGRVWTAVAWRAKAEITLGRREAGKVLSLVIAAGHQPGVYRLEDVLIEYAITREPSVHDNLIRIISPLVQHPALFATLKTLIATNGNRSQAADRLIIHRSTLDYRVQRIEQLTGLRPGGVRGINVLSAAVTAHAIAAQAERSQAVEEKIGSRR